MYPTTSPGSDEYVSLNIGEEGAFFVKSSSKSIWRQWNQLSRFQRNIFYFLTIAIFLILFYLLPTNSENAIYDENNNDIKAVQDIPKHDKELKDLHVASAKNLADDAKESHQGPKDTINLPFNDKNIIPDVIEKNSLDKIEKSSSEAQVKKNSLKFSGPQNDRQKAVVKAFMHSWNGYKQYAWGHDNVKPISGKFHDWFGLALTIVDSLDTMFIMGLNEEFEEAKNWIKNDLLFTKNRDVNLFEVTIRVLGGLLAAYHLSGDSMFLNKSIDLGERMMPAFSTRSNVPFSDVNLGTKNAHSPKWGPDSSTSEITSIQLEFRDLSRCTGRPEFEEAVAKVSEHIHTLEKYDGLVPIFINPNTGMFREYSTITLGARGDSYYEYLLKQWIQTGKTIDYLKDDYLAGISGTLKHLVKRTALNKYVFIAELMGPTKDVRPKMDHLTCYLSGTLALGYHNGLSSDHMELAEELVNTCYQTYLINPTHLAAEITYFNIMASADSNQKDMYVKNNDAHNLLRPEFIESLYYMWYYTGNKTYQDWGWKIFQAFENHTRVKYGFTSINNVKNLHNTQPRDMTESFWLAETLKYSYLLFDDSRRLINLSEWIFNSEGHPLPIYNS